MDPASLWLFAFLVSLSAFFSGTELALMTLSAHRVESIAKTGGFSARILKRLKANPDRLLVTILIGNNLANVGASALATVSALTLAESLRLPGEYGIAIATGAVTFILLMFGEITPKSLAAKHAVSISLAVAPIYAVLVVLFLPISIVLEAFLWVVGRIFGTHRLSDVMTSEELEAFIDFSHKQGAVEDDERKQLKNLLDLAETEAEEAMTPRVRVNFAQLDMTVDEVCDLFLRLPHSRLPVYGRSHDDVDYVVTMRVAFAHRWAGRGTSKLRDLKLEKIIKAPITQPLDTILETFQKSRKHIALLLDEHGGVAGIITLEDVIEEVFGEIQDETDREVREIRTLSDGSLSVQGGVLIDDVLDEMGLEFRDVGLDESFSWEPASYVLLSELARFPDEWEYLMLSGEDTEIRLTAAVVEKGVIREVRIERVGHAENPNPET